MCSSPRVRRIKLVLYPAFWYLFSVLFFYAIFGNYSIDKNFPMYDLIYVGIVVFFVLFIAGTLLSLMLILTLNYFGSKAKSSLSFCMTLGGLYGLIPWILLINGEILTHKFTLSDFSFLAAGAVLGFASSREFRKL